MCCILGGMTYKPGTYVKGNQARVAETPADAVAAVFEGFKLQEQAPAPAEPEEVQVTSFGDNTPIRVDPEPVDEDDEDLNRLGSDFA